MNAVLFNQNQRLVGSLIDAIEYYLYMFLYNKDNYLIFPGDNPEYKDMVLNLIKNRYDIYPDNGYENNILTVSHKDLLTKFKFEKCLILDWGSIPRLKCRFRAKELIVISELFTEDKKFFFDKEKYHATYYSEMPFVYSDKFHNMKFLFEFYSKFEQKGDLIYINSPENDIQNDPNIQNYLMKNFPNKQILSKDRKKHKNNLFEHFDTYLYYHANKYFDPHPRLFHECFFYGKEIYFENPDEAKDGAYERYNDLMKNGLENRYFSKDDEVIRLFI